MRRALWALPLALSLACIGGQSQARRSHETVQVDGVRYQPVCRRALWDTIRWDCDSFVYVCRGGRCEVAPRAEVPPDVVERMRLDPPRVRWRVEQVCDDCVQRRLCGQPVGFTQWECETTTVDALRFGNTSDWQPPEAVLSSPSAPRTGGRVHVRGYYRRDGTYVRPHTRRR